jgi:glycerol-3-phosphate O-acyltransferase
MDAVLGLPAFLYSAGLNLFNYSIPAYFMNRLGAYRLDRRKRNHIYLQTLKSMSELALIQDINTLFFAGGTRSRSGALENRLKLGLLGTTISAQRKLYAKGSDRKIYIAPLIISYNFVLEGKHLIHQFLKAKGREKYSYTKDKSQKVRHILNFIWRLFRRDSEIVLSFAPVMDVLGNRLDSEGKSLDKKGQEVDIKQYFMGEDGIEAHKQREEVYTKRLSQSILEAFRQYNIVLPSHLLSFVALEALMKKFEHLDFYQVLHLSPEEAILEFDLFEKLVARLREILLEKALQGELLLHEKIKEGVGQCIQSGLDDIGIYHPQKPIVRTKDNKIISQDITLLYYYRNRLDEYGLKKELKEILEKELNIH